MVVQLSQSLTEDKVVDSGCQPEFVNGDELLL